ncbi:MAG: hypothetical protein AAF399_01155, partial [Bacteroidota bacterium]
MIYQPDIEQIPLEQLRTLQSKRLHHLLQRLNLVPMYRDRFQEKGIDPAQIRNIEQLSELPFTYTEDLRTHSPFGMFASPMEEVRRIHASSGTTGKPTVVGYTKADLEIFDEVVARSLVAAGARPGMKLHNAYGYGLMPVVEAAHELLVERNSGNGFGEVYREAVSTSGLKFQDPD